MRNIRQLLVAFLMSAVVACGGGGTLGTGGTPTTPVYTVSASITPVANLNQSTNLTVSVKVTASSGVASGKLVTFTLSDAELATFSNQAGTALTDASGIATIQLFVGNKSGAGKVTATLDSGEKAEVGFTSEGKTNVGDVLSLTMELIPATPAAPVTSCGAREVSRACQPQLKVKLSSAQGKSTANRQVKLTIPATDTNKASFAGGASSATLSLGADGSATTTLQVGTEANDGRVEATVVDASEVASVFTGFSSKGDYYSVKLLANKLVLGTGNIDVVELMALVQNPGNVVVKDIRVDFATESSTAELEVLNALTANDGIAKAKLSSKTDFTHRFVKVSATVGKQKSETLDIQVSGNRIEIQKPASVVLNSQTEIILTLTDSTGSPIAAVNVEVSSALGNQLSFAGGAFATKVTAKTDVTGKIKLTYLAGSVGGDTLKATALNTSASSALTVNGDAFAFSPAVGDTPLEIDINQQNPALARLVTVWSSNNAPVVGQQVRFKSSRGILQNPWVSTPDYSNPSPLLTTTDAAGSSSVFARSRFTGFTTIDATAIRAGQDVATASRAIEFVSSDPRKIEVQVFPAQVGVNEKASVRAVIRDNDNNPVKNKKVVFQLDNASGGVLNPVEAVTNSQGVAVTEFTADQTTGANTGANLNIRAYVMDSPSVAGTTAVAVGGRTLFFRFGTGNTISKPNVSTYSKQFSVIVTDSSGNPVPNQALNVAVVPVAYNYGFWQEYPTNGTFVRWTAISTKSCASEDVNNNGILDNNEKDDNGDGQLTPGNVVKVEKTVTSGPITTDLSGVAVFNLVYPQDYGAWTTVRLMVSGLADGTDNVSSRLYTLGVSAEDVGNEKSPPVANAFGVTGNCTLYP